MPHPDRLVSAGCVAHATYMFAPMLPGSAL